MSAQARAKSGSASSPPHPSSSSLVPTAGSSNARDYKARFSKAKARLEQVSADNSLLKSQFEKAAAKHKRLQEEVDWVLDAISEYRVRRLGPDSSEGSGVAGRVIPIKVEPDANVPIGIVPPPAASARSGAWGRTSQTAPLTAGAIALGAGGLPKAGSVGRGSKASTTPAAVAAPAPVPTGGGRSGSVRAGSKAGSITRGRSVRSESAGIAPVGPAAASSTSASKGGSAAGPGGIKRAREEGDAGGGEGDGGQEGEEVDELEDEGVEDGTSAAAAAAGGAHGRGKGKKKPRLV